MEDTLIIEMKNPVSGENKILSFEEFDKILENAENDDSLLEEFPHIKAYFKISDYVVFKGIYGDGTFKVLKNELN